MKYWTYGEIEDKVRKDLGLEQEEFVTESEMLEYCNEAIDACEAEIHTNYEDYFLSRSAQSIVTGQDLYDLPSNIYAHKIRALIYSDGSNDVYDIKRYKRSTSNPFLELERDSLLQNFDFRYIILNDDGTSLSKIKLIPTPTTNLSNGIVMYYYRNANRMEDRTSICDIPEFISFILQHMKVRCYEKEGHPNLSLAVATLERIRNNMNVTLNDMTPDGDNQVEADLDIYESMQIEDMGGF